MLSRRRWATGRESVLVLGMALAVALGARMQPWSRVFPAGIDGAVFVGDTDTYYHTLRAERIAADFPTVSWFDEGMNFPDGAEILWPPLFDFTVAGIARAVSEGPPARATVERVAAVVPPLLGTATVALAAALGFALFRNAAGSWAALLLALLPVHVEFTTVGRPDQHALESFLQTSVMLAFVASWRCASLRWAWRFALGVALALSFWNWQGSALYLLLLAAFVAVWHVLDGDGAHEARRALAISGGIGAALLAASIALWGENGSLLAAGLGGVKGVQVVLTALVAVFALGLTLLNTARRGRSTALRRVLEVGLASAIPMAAAVLLFPSLRDGVRQGLLALTAGNPWYASIREFQPPLFGGTGIGRELAAWVPRFAPMFAMPVAALGLARRWRRRPEDRPALGFLAVWGALLLVATLARLRFALYLSVPAVLWSAVGLRELARSAVAFAVVIVLVLAPAAFYFGHGGLWPDPVHREVATTLAWLRARPAADLGRPAVFSEWDWGHLVQYFAGRPAIATPFGTDGGSGAMADAAEFFLTRSPERAERILERRRAGYVLLVDPVTHAAAFAPFAPAGGNPPVRVEWRRIHGPRMSVEPEVDDLVAVRIYYDSGLSSRGLPTLTHYRLVYEGSPEVGRQPRLFEVVRGAEIVVVGAPAGGTVRAQTWLRTNRGRQARWHVDGQVDATGSARLTVPFSTGENGVVTASPYRVSCAGSESGVVVPPGAVEAGARIEVVCGGAS